MLQPANIIEATLSHRVPFCNVRLHKCALLNGWFPGCHVKSNGFGTLHKTPFAWDSSNQSACQFLWWTQQNYGGQTADRSVICATLGSLMSEGKRKHLDWHSESIYCRFPYRPWMDPLRFGSYQTAVKAKLPRMSQPDICVVSFPSQWGNNLRDPLLCWNVGTPC